MSPLRRFWEEKREMGYLQCDPRFRPYKRSYLTYKHVDLISANLITHRVVQVDYMPEIAGNCRKLEYFIRCIVKKRKTSVKQNMPEIAGN